MADQNEWHKSSGKVGSRLFERKIGKFWLEVRPERQDDPDGETWCAFIEVEEWSLFSDGKEIGHPRDERQISRETIGASFRHPSCESAQAAAEAMLASVVAPLVATARAEAALAEREACADLSQKHSDSLFITSAIRARTTPDTLSNDTLAAIAKARGLRVVQLERLVELEAAAKDAAAERNACAASLVWERARRDAHDKAHNGARVEALDTAHAAAAIAEREACAAEVDAFAAQVQNEIDSTWPVGHKLDQLVAARTVLQKAVAMIRARSSSDRAATASPAPERS